MGGWVVVRLLRCVHSDGSGGTVFLLEILAQDSLHGERFRHYRLFYVRYLRVRYRVRRIIPLTRDQMLQCLLCISTYTALLKSVISRKLGRRHKLS
jgi:hypothetical protein